MLDIEPVRPGRRHELLETPVALGQDAGTEQAVRVIRHRAHVAPGACRENLAAGSDTADNRAAACWRSAWVRFLLSSDHTCGASGRPWRNTLPTWSMMTAADPSSFGRRHRPTC